MGTGPFPAGKPPRNELYFLPTSIAEVKERVELHLYSPSVL
jgi:hypothetical protein